MPLDLLRQGLMISVLGMGLVFVGLGALWGMMALLTRVFRPEAEEAAGRETPEVVVAESCPDSGAALTAERARVAAMVAGALLAHALPWQPDVPAGPAFEHGRTAPSWVSTNRARIMRPWQPPRPANQPDQRRRS